VSKLQLIFKPTDDEEEYLRINGKLDSWTKTVRDWVKHDKKYSKKRTIDRVQNSFVLIFTGILAFVFSLILPIDFANKLLVNIIVFLISVIAVTYGSISIVWEVYLHVKR